MVILDPINQDDSSLIPPLALDFLPLLCNCVPSLYGSGLVIQTSSASSQVPRNLPMSKCSLNLCWAGLVYCETQKILKSP